MICIASYVLAEIGFFIFAPTGFADLHSFLPTELGFMSAVSAWVGMALFAGTPATVTIAHSTSLTATANQSTAVA
jgi:hypothetical protein